ncbi:hypothetical protein EE612_045389 [Oryza sativa]|nr:hypothetical protein EE612_045389 [Oryza sativa]
MENHPFPKRRRLMAPPPRSASAAAAAGGGFIPDDILFSEILVRLPAKCLVRFQSVCKLWRATIISTSFARRHLEHSRPRPSMVVMPRMFLSNPKKFKLQGVTFYRFQPGQSKVAELILEKRFPRGIPMFSMPLHCDGLILIPCVSGEIFVCNLTTSEFVELPRGSHSVALEHRVAFGFDPWSGKYKVARHFLRSSHSGGESRAGHEILTLGDGEDCWKWKATIDPPYPINARTPICLPGFFYWSALHSTTGHGLSKVSSHVILRFSLRDETFTVHPNPPCRGFLSNNDMLCQLGGKLCYVHSASPCELAIWLAADGPSLAWSLRCRIRLPIPKQLVKYVIRILGTQYIRISFPIH